MLLAIHWQKMYRYYLPILLIKIVGSKFPRAYTQPAASLVLQALCLMISVRKKFFSLSVRAEPVQGTVETTCKISGKACRIYTFCLRAVQCTPAALKRKWLLSAVLRTVSRDLIILLKSQGIKLWFKCLSSEIFSESWLLVSWLLLPISKLFDLRSNIRCN